MLGLELSPTAAAIFRRSSPYNPSTDALFAALTGSYSDALKLAINTAIIALKDLGAWADFDVLYVKGAFPGTSAANIADGYLNWKAPGSFKLIPVNSPTNGDGYWQGDGASARLRTQYTPSVNGVKYTQNSSSIMLWAKEAAVAATADAGAVNGLNPAYLDARATATQVIGVMNGAGAIVVASTDGLGLTMIQRRATNDVRVYKGGAQLGATLTTSASTGVPTNEQWVLGGNSTQFSSGKKIQLAAWGASQVGREASIPPIFQTLFTAAGTI